MFKLLAASPRSFAKGSVSANLHPNSSTLTVDPFGPIPISRSPETLPTNHSHHQPPPCIMLLLHLLSATKLGQRPTRARKGLTTALRNTPRSNLGQKACGQDQLNDGRLDLAEERLALLGCKVLLPKLVVDLRPSSFRATRLKVHPPNQAQLPLNARELVSLAFSPPFRIGGRTSTLRAHMDLLGWALLILRRATCGFRLL